MKPKLKAEELVEKYQKVELLKDVEGMWDLLAIECAKIAIEEIIKEVQLYQLSTEYWQEVKNELNKM